MCIYNYTHISITPRLAVGVKPMTLRRKTVSQLNTKAGQPNILYNMYNIIYPLRKVRNR